MENTTPPPNAPSVYSPYFSSEKELLKDVAKAETRIDNHDKEIEALKKKMRATRRGNQQTQRVESLHDGRHRGLHVPRTACS